MGENSSFQSQNKRKFILEDEEEAPAKKKVRFPKGKKDAKKVKIDEIPVDDPIAKADARSAAKERAKRRNQITVELFNDQDCEDGEENYEDDGNFEEGGVIIEPFNLSKEREDGYFDADGNFVEYVKESEIKDAWLDSVDVEPRYAENKNVVNSREEEEVQDLSSKDIGKIKRRIANVLQGGETVLQALRRLKGNSNDKKGKMSEETKRLFDQLTEDSMKLMDNGEYNVYHDEREVFEREAEGYEHLAHAREGTTVNEGVVFSTEAGTREGFSASDGMSGHSKSNLPTAQVSPGNGGDDYDMFGDDENTAPHLPSNGDSLNSLPTPENAATELGTDYVYDETSGYYYSSSLGYYYDPTSGLHCCATSGKWYSYNEQTGAYDEVPAVAAADGTEGQSS